MPVAGHGVLIGLAEVTETASVVTWGSQAWSVSSSWVCTFFFLQNSLSPISLASTPCRDQHLSFRARLDAQGPSFQRRCPNLESGLLI